MLTSNSGQKRVLSVKVHSLHVQTDLLGISADVVCIGSDPSVAVLPASCALSTQHPASGLLLNPAADAVHDGMLCGIKNLVSCNAFSERMLL